MIALWSSSLPAQSLKTWSIYIKFVTLSMSFVHFPVLNLAPSFIASSHTLSLPLMEVIEAASSNAVLSSSEFMAARISTEHSEVLKLSFSGDAGRSNARTSKASPASSLLIVWIPPYGAGQAFGIFPERLSAQAHMP